MLFGAVLLSAVWAPPANAATTPVPGRVIDGFRPPPTPYSAGNRGIDYETSDGADVAVVEAGVVTFAGRVGGQLFVTVRHGSGLRTTYGYLKSLAVSVGEVVREGQRVGTSLKRMHFGLRSGDRYLDPSLLFRGATLVKVGSEPTVVDVAADLVKDEAWKWLLRTTTANLLG